MSAIGESVDPPAGGASAPRSSGARGFQLPFFRHPGRHFAAWIEKEREARTAFAFLPVGMILAILAVFGFAWRPSPVWPLALALACAAALLLYGNRPFVRPMLLLPIGFALGLGASAVEFARTSTVMLSGEATTRIEGQVRLREKDERGRYRYTIDLVGTERPTLSRPPDRVRILVSSRHAPLEIGATYRGLVRLRPPAGPAWPGGYDFAFAPYFGGLGAYGFSLGAPEPADPPAALSLEDRLTTLRLSIGDRVRAVLPGATGAVAAALINGERAGIPPDVEEALRVTGLAHVLSISGFHMALVAGLTMVAVRSLLALLPGIALRWQARKIAAVAALGVTGFYFLMAGDNAATERSFVMIAVMLGAVLVDRPALTLRSVSIAALVVMLLSPHAVLTATFQMSFAATVALVGAYGAYARWMHERRDRHEPSRLGRWRLILLGVVLSSLIAGAATAPYGIYHFHRAAPFGLFANVLATPIFSFWIMPLALLAVLLMPLGLESLALRPMGWGLDLVFAMAQALAETFPDRAVGQIGVAALLLLTLAILILSFCRSPLRWTAILPAALALLLVPKENPPELLISEDARDVLLVTATADTAGLRERPNRFVHEQWQRAFRLAPPSGPWAEAESDASRPIPETDRALAATGAPEPTPDHPGRALAWRPDPRLPNPSGAQENSTARTDPPVATPGRNAADLAFTCSDDICRAVTRSGLRVGWTRELERIGELCDTADIAIVARAARLDRCRSGAHLVTLRTLRLSGTLAVWPGEGGRPAIRPSVRQPLQEWNLHRQAPWPESYRRETAAEPAAQ